MSADSLNQGGSWGRVSTRMDSAAAVTLVARLGYVFFRIEGVGNCGDKQIGLVWISEVDPIYFWFCKIVWLLVLLLLSGDHSYFNFNIDCSMVTINTVF